MPTIPAGFAEATFIFNVSGKVRDCTWSLGFDVTDFGTLTAFEMADELRAIWTATDCPYVAGQIATGWTFQGVSVTKQLEDGPISAQSLFPVVGTVSVGPLPVNCALLFAKQTTAGGRRNRGRAFVPPVHLSETDINAIGVITADTTSLQGRYTEAVNDSISSGYQPCLFHQSAPFTPTDVTGLSLSSLIATQRRRMRS